MCGSIRSANKPIILGTMKARSRDRKAADAPFHFGNGRCCRILLIHDEERHEALAGWIDRRRGRSRSDYYCDYEQRSKTEAAAA